MTRELGGAILMGACITAAAQIIAGTGEGAGTETRGRHVAELAHEIYQASMKQFGVGLLRFES